VETALLENAPAVHAEVLKSNKILQHGVLNTTGMSIAANVLFLMKVEEMQMLSITIQIIHLILDYGK
jgi:hypothetical protein